MSRWAGPKCPAGWLIVKALKRVKTVEKKKELVDTHRLCINCLAPGHFGRNCFSKHRCNICGRKHHTLLHRGDAGVANSVQLAVVANSTNAVLHDQTYQLLTTAVIQVKNKKGEWINARALLDGGAQSNLVTEDLCRKLQVDGQRADIKLKAIGDRELHCGKIVSLEIKSRLGCYERKVNFRILQKITNEQPSIRVSKTKELLPRNMMLADPRYDKCGVINLLLGQEFFYELHKLSGSGMQFYEMGELRLVNTRLGWIASGRVAAEAREATSCNVLIGNCLTEVIERFWQVEEIPETSRRTQQEEDCERHFMQHHFRDREGRYVVKLPFKRAEEPHLGDSREAACKRFGQLERRLARDRELRKGYEAVVLEYQQSGILKELSDGEVEAKPGYYLPHHPDIKLDSNSTKKRPVFYASAKTSNGHSLNGLLLTGPVIQDSLFDLVLRFRTHRVALLADVEKMYLQIRVHPDDTRYQRMLWRSDANSSVNTYELQRITFGFTSSSFLATRVLYHLAEDEGKEFEKAAEVLKRDFYVDDYIGGAESEQAARSLKQDLVQLLARGGFVLKKWCSNVSDLRMGVTSNNFETDSSVFPLGYPDCTKALGVAWDPISCLFKRTSPPRPSVGREDSIIAKLFDPLGIIGPILTWAKIRMQLLWIAMQGWDTPIPEIMASEWRNFYGQLSELNELLVQRCPV